jgi:hypothetical protein
MKTEDLIAALSHDTRPRANPLQVFGVAIVPALAVSFVFYGLVLHPRAGILHLLQLPRVQGKFLLSLAVIVSLSAAVLRSARPGARDIGWARYVMPVVVVGLWIAGLVTTPAGARMQGFLGQTIVPCLVTIPVISASILAAILFALRAGAATDPRMAGFLGGLVAGAIGAIIYSTHCTEDNPMFYATWYTMGILIVGAAGAGIAPRVLRW